MLKKILLNVILLSVLYSSAQVTVNVQIPPAGMIQKDQLWNLVLVNNMGEINDAGISLDLQDVITGQTVLSAVSRSFILGKGIKLISSKDVQPIQYNYMSAELSGTYIPLGTYVACFRIVRNTPKGPEPLGDECVKINISPLSPPLLNTPADRSVLPSGYPQFSWMPPSPANLFNNLNYDIVVTELMEGQSPAEAIRYNIPVYSNHDLQIAYENYPVTFSKLKEGQAYAWQVTARNGYNYAAQTEIWSFVISPRDSINNITTEDGYIFLNEKGEYNGITAVTGAVLKVKFYSFDKSHDAKLKLLTDQGKVVMEVKQRIAYGDNFMQFKLNNQFQKGQLYTIELQDEQKKIFSSRFSIK